MQRNNSVYLQWPSFACLFLLPLPSSPADLSIFLQAFFQHIYNSLWFGELFMTFACRFFNYYLVPSSTLKWNSLSFSIQFSRAISISWKSLEMKNKAWKYLQSHEGFLTVLWLCWGFRVFCYFLVFFIKLSYKFSSQGLCKILGSKSQISMHKWLLTWRAALTFVYLPCFFLWKMF